MIRQIPTADRKTLEQNLKRLRLPHIRNILDDVNELALEEEPSYLDFLAYVINKEVEHRDKTQQEKRMKRACFPQIKTLEEFDCSFTKQHHPTKHL
ncbi:MAG: ATP-binding protein [Bacillota bacterium]